jgi:hypothetical protein
MKATMKVRWSITVKIITLLVTVIVGCAIYSLIVNGKIILPIVLAAVLLFIFACAPLSITLNHSELVLKKVFGRIHIPYRQIEMIEPYALNNDIRLFGSGGFCGYIGIFSNNEKGRYHAYIGTAKHSFFIAAKSGKKYAFSCENAPFVIETVKNHMQHGNV